MPQPARNQDTGRAKSALHENKTTPSAKTSLALRAHNTGSPDNDGMKFRMNNFDVTNTYAGADARPLLSRKMP